MASDEQLFSPNRLRALAIPWAEERKAIAGEICDAAF
jgi:hypothetical protein